MADINFHLDFRINPSRVRWLAVLFLLSAMAPELNSESVSLTTYYPSPSGIYAQMITTQQTMLARDGGNVAVGTTNVLSKLNVNGSISAGTYTGTASPDTNGMIISGRVG